jgi:hypothetical protein
MLILKQHMDICVKDAIRMKNRADKIDEITLIVGCMISSSSTQQLPSPSTRVSA